jgi:P-type Ca2+ transporter type 2C
VLNAILGLNQEGKAAESVAALQKMLLIKAHVRRGGALLDIPAEELVPGDIASFEAGDKIPPTAAFWWLRRWRSRRQL